MNPVSNCSQDTPDISKTVLNMRHFDVFDVKWKIEYFNLATCPDSWSIQSPEFTLAGICTTNWVMRITSINSAQNNFEISLQRCDFNTTPKYIYVDWRLSVCNQNNYKFTVLDRFSVFEKGTWILESLNNCKDLVEIFKSAENEFLTFRCKMILFSSLDSKEFQPSSHKGKRSLSENLMKLLDSGIKSDLALLVNNRRIMVHKAIMCSRIKRFFYLIEDARYEYRQNDNENILDSKEVDVLDLSYFSYIAAESLVKYAYSGDLVHVLSKPSLDIYDCMRRLNESNVMMYFRAKKVAFQSSLNVRKIKKKWEITNFSENCNYAMESPVILDDFSVQWQVVLLQHSSLDYFSAFVNTRGQVEGTSLSLEIAVKNEGGDVVFKKMLKCSTADLSNLGFDKFIRRDLLERFVKNNTLRLGMKVKITHGIMTHSNVYYNADAVTIPSRISLDSFDALSVHMYKLFQNGDFSDVEFYFSGLCFKVHRCILAVSSTYFSKLLHDEGDNDLINVPNIGPGFSAEIMSMLLTYLYSGIVETKVRKELEELKQAALCYDVPILKELCEDLLLQIE